MMETNDLDSNSKYLMDQLMTARKEINNLRQQIKSLRFVHERDVTSIKRLLGLCTSGLASFPDESLGTQASSASIRDSEPSTSKNSSIEDYSLTCRPIGTISTWFPNKRGTPRQPTVCGKAPGKITLFKSVFTNPEHALQGLDEYSHMWILFHFHKNELAHVRAKVAPPRLNGIRTGVFSTRSPHRPCPIGLSLVKIIKIEDYTIYFEGVDMVDQTPVLDIKPYIPDYDNPMYIEKFLNSTQSKDETRGNDVAESIGSSISDMDAWMTGIRHEPISASDNAHISNHRKVIHTNSIIDNQSLIQVSSSSSSSTSSLMDISRDEELALRLQTEEFSGHLNFENVYINNENPSVLGENDLPIVTNRTNSSPASYEAADSEVSSNDEQNPRNSRLLDGADGPNAVCGTDLDLINRRALNLRFDDSSSSSSPVRMGVREAPDGEEGFDLSYNAQQSYNAQATNSTSASSNVNINSQIVTDQAQESTSEDTVRIPDWISRPKTASLTVVFNERSMLQLHEILNDKAEEKKRAVENVLKEDPRSVYLRSRYGNQFYTFLIHDLHITCRFDDDRKVVTVFQIRHAGRMCECGLPDWQCSGHSPPPVFNHDQ